MVRAHKLLVAQRTGESLLAGVCAEVTLKLVRACETLPAEEPVADEGPLAGVPAEVGLQVGALVVDLSTAGDVARVDALLAEVERSSRAEPLRLGAVGTVARGASRVPPL